MSTHPAQHESPGAHSRENAPRVIVRAEKYLLCTACGTLVEIPADVVGQLALVVDPSPSPSNSELPPILANAPPHSPASDAQPQPSPSNSSQPPATIPAGSSFATAPVSLAERRPRSTSQTSRPPRPKRPASPQRKSFQGKIIDGLAVPSGRQLDRALAWVTFHLKVIDRQGSELQRIKKLLKKSTSPEAPCPPPSGQAKPPSDQQPPPQQPRAQESHTHEAEAMAPRAPSLQERGPP